MTYRLLYKDIPKFTKTPGYRVNAGLEYFKEWIDRQTSELGLNLSPDFQRGYVWTHTQKVKYIEFILQGGLTARDFYFNHPGWMNSWKGEFVCVDGLQRIMSILDFVANNFPVFGNYYFDEIKLPAMDPTITININDLKTRKEVLKWYLEFNSGGTVHTEAELDKVRKMIEEEEKQ